MNRSDVPVLLAWLLWGFRRGRGSSVTVSVGAIVGLVLCDVVAAALGDGGRTIRGFYASRCGRIHPVKALPRRQTDCA